ncbi:MAG: hypothetical protein OXR67_00910 [Chloroflexota bacterium]|nr:hypothetical protein [Chloroflexota bacterium]
MEVVGTHNSSWLLNVAMLLLILFAFSATLPLLTGLACGWKLRSLSVRGGFFVGISVGIMAFLLSLAAIFVNAPSLAIVILPVPPAVVWLLCWRADRRKMRVIGD